MGAYFSLKANRESGGGKSQDSIQEPKVESDLN
jgi:hypothetical protein